MPPSKSMKYFLVERLILNRIWTKKVSLRVLLGIPIYEVISTWMSNNYLKLNLFKTDLLITSYLAPPIVFFYTSYFAPPVVFSISINSNSILQVFRPKISELSLTSSIFSHLTPNPSGKPSFLYFQNRSRITSSTAPILVQVTIISHLFLQSLLHRHY